MSNNPSENSDNKAAGKAKSRGPSLRIETAGDIPEEKLTRVAAKFAEVNEVEDYRLSIETREDLNIVDTKIMRLRELLKSLLQIRFDLCNGKILLGNSPLGCFASA